MRYFFFSLILSLFSFTSVAQDLEQLFNYYERTLPKSYIDQLKQIKIEGLGSKRMDELQGLLEKSSSSEDLISCIQNSYSSVSLTEMQSILGQVTKHVARTSKKIPCNNKTAKITKDDLNKIHTHLLSNNLYKNDFPGGNCFDRAYLLSKELNDKGIDSEQLLINDYVVAAYETSSGYSAESYPVHIANVVTVKEGSDLNKYVIDPMYFDRPVTLEEYKRIVFFNPKSKYYSFQRQDYNAAEDRQHDCSYSEFRLEEARQNILSSQENRPPLGLSVSYKTAEDALSEFRKKMMD